MASFCADAQDAGNSLMQRGTYERSQRFFFEAAHTLDRPVERERSLRIGGHRFHAGFRPVRCRTQHPTPLSRVLHRQPGVADHDVGFAGPPVKQECHARSPACSAPAHKPSPSSWAIAVGESHSPSGAPLVERRVSKLGIAYPLEKSLQHFFGGLRKRLSHVGAGFVAH